MAQKKKKFWQDPFVNLITRYQLNKQSQWEIQGAAGVKTVIFLINPQYEKGMYRFERKISSQCLRKIALYKFFKVSFGGEGNHMRIGQEEKEIFEVGWEICMIIPFNSYKQSYIPGQTFQKNNSLRSIIFSMQKEERSQLSFPQLIFIIKFGQQFQYKHSYFFKVIGDQINLPFNKTMEDKWILTVIDIKKLFIAKNFLNIDDYPQAKDYDVTGELKQTVSFKLQYALQRVQICSNIKVGGIITSDIIYDIYNIPEAFNFVQIDRFQKWKKFFFEKKILHNTEPYLYILDTKSDTEFAKKLKKSKQKKKLKVKKGKKDIVLDSAKTIKKFPILAREEYSQKHFNSNDTQFYDFRKDLCSFRGGDKLVGEQKILRLSHIMGFPSSDCSQIAWNPSQINSNDIIYSAGELLITLNIKTKHQKFFTGSTAKIKNIEASSDGNLIITSHLNQLPYCPLVKVWDYNTVKCIKTFEFRQLTQIDCISLSMNDQCLAIQGNDRFERQMILLLSLEKIRLQEHRLPMILGKHVSEEDIIAMSFSPYEANTLVTCGKQNIMIYKIKAGQLMGRKVILDKCTPKLRFLSLGFNSIQTKIKIDLVRQTTPLIIYVGTADGLLYLIDYNKNFVIGIFRIHNDQVRAVATNQCYCITGSNDKFLKTWSLDIGQTFKSNQLQGKIVSLDVSGNYVACGTSNGELGILNVVTQKYTSIMRSHSAEVYQFDLLCGERQLITLSKDLTIRI